MPRAGPTKPAVAPRLPDRIAIGGLTRTFPPELVDRVIARTGRGEQRQRLLPARVVVYYTLAMRLVGLVEYGTHAVVDAAMGGLHLDEGTLAPSLARSLGPGMLLLVDQGLCGLELRRTFQATGAELVWRCRQDVKLKVLAVFADGSWASELGAGHPKHQRVAVRVVDYRLDDPGRPGDQEGYRLITTILDPERAPAAELSALYLQRWELETALDELKTHQRGPGVVLRSRHPDGVRQEVWAHLLVHYAIRTLMHQAALDGEVDPDRLSYTRSLHIARRQVTSQARVFPLGGWPGRPGRRSLRHCGTCWPHAGCAPSRGRSSAR